VREALEAEGIGGTGRRLLQARAEVPVFNVGSWYGNSVLLLEGGGGCRRGVARRWDGGAGAVFGKGSGSLAKGGGGVGS